MKLTIRPPLAEKKTWRPFWKALQKISGVTLRFLLQDLLEAVEKMTNSPLPSRILVTKNARLSTCQEGWGEDGHALTFPYLNNLKSYSAKSVIPKILWRVDGNDTFWSGNAFVMFLEKVPWESAGTIFSCPFYVYCFIYLSICLFIYLFYVYILSVLCIGFPT